MSIRLELEGRKSKQQRSEEAASFKLRESKLQSDLSTQLYHIRTAKRERDIAITRHRELLAEREGIATELALVRGEVWHARNDLAALQDKVGGVDDLAAHLTQLKAEHASCPDSRTFHALAMQVSSLQHQVLELKEENASVSQELAELHDEVNHDKAPGGRAAVGGEERQAGEASSQKAGMVLLNMRGQCLGTCARETSQTDKTSQTGATAGLDKAGRTQKLQEVLWTVRQSWDLETNDLSDFSSVTEDWPTERQRDKEHQPSERIVERILARRPARATQADAFDGSLFSNPTRQAAADSEERQHAQLALDTQAFDDPRSSQESSLCTHLDDPCNHDSFPAQRSVSNCTESICNIWFMCAGSGVFLAWNRVLLTPSRFFKARRCRADKFCNQTAGLSCYKTAKSAQSTQE